MISKKALIQKGARVGKNTKVWANTKIGENAKVGNNCIIGENVYIDHDVKIGNNVKIQNNSLIYFESEIEDDVFIGPASILTNDKYPRATNPDSTIKTKKDWQVGKITIHKGASLGAGSIILTNTQIGFWAMVGAGSVVTRSIPNFALAMGNPAKIKGHICKKGHIARIKTKNLAQKTNYFCKVCNKNYEANG